MAAEAQQLGPSATSNRAPTAAAATETLPEIVTTSGNTSRDLAGNLERHPAITKTSVTQNRSGLQKATRSTSIPVPGNELAIAAPNESQQQRFLPASSLAAQNGQWMAVATQTTLGMRQRMSLASDQLSLSLRQLYASASSITDVPPSYHNIPGIVPYYSGRSSGPPPSYDDVINPYAAPPTYQSLFGQMREARKSSRGLIDLLRRLLIILISTLGCTILIAFMILIPFTMIIVGAIYIDDCRVEHIPAFLLVGGLVWASKNIIHCYTQCREQDDPQRTPPPHPSPLPPEPLVSPARQSALQSALEGVSGQLDTTSTGRSLTISGVVAGAELESLHQQQSQTQSQPLHMGYPNQRRLKSSICESLLNCVLFGWFIAGCVIVFRNYEPDFDNPDSARYCNRTVYLYTFWLITSAILTFSLFIGCICCLMVSSAIASRQEDDLA